MLVSSKGRSASTGLGYMTRHILPCFTISHFDESQTHAQLNQSAPLNPQIPLHSMSSSSIYAYV